MYLRNLVDVDEPETWPSNVREQAERWASDLHGTTEYVGDLDLEMEDEDDLRALLRGRYMTAYHATRLLDHEVERIRADGLRLASREIVRDRVETAYQHGIMDDDLRSLLLSANVFHERDARNRSDQVCLVLSRRAFEHSPHAVRPLLTQWGGELITSWTFGNPVMNHSIDMVNCPATERYGSSPLIASSRT